MYLSITAEDQMNQFSLIDRTKGRLTVYGIKETAVWNGNLYSENRSGLDKDTL